MTHLHQMHVFTTSTHHCCNMTVHFLTYIIIYKSTQTWSTMTENENLKGKKTLLTMIDDDVFLFLRVNLSHYRAHESMCARSRRRIQSIHSQFNHQPTRASKSKTSAHLMFYSEDQCDCSSPEFFGLFIHHVDTVSCQSLSK